MNIITKYPIANLGYGFVPPKYLPKGKDEYYLRNIQNPFRNYRKLKVSEVEILIRNGNNSDDWNNIFVSSEFDPALVKNSKFLGMIRIGKLEPYYLEYHNLRMAVGIYNSTIISCDLGDNVCIDNTNYLSHYIIGNEVMIANISEFATTNYSKFGNGILKDGEQEKVRIKIELRNENGGRSVIPFNDMLPGDAALWSEYPEDEILHRRLTEMTSESFPARRGYYGTVGDRCVIKDCNIIKDVKIGSDAYIKGANKLKNLTINSNEESPSQIGEGCELVNGIVGVGCRIFYGVKAVRFILADHSQLKYGARLINSYLGSNSTISCCEVLNSLIYPAHEQHHNNSFLTASLVKGQSNIAAGATIGSNHNSRGADGEIIAGRGFWPGLCVNMKHNSRFASFTILVKGDYPHEMDIKIPFSLVTNNVAKNHLTIIPGYWFRYNMYALARNAWKFHQRDHRKNPVQKIEYEYLAPDTVNEMFDALRLLHSIKPDDHGNGTITGLENSNRPTEIKDVNRSIELFRELIIFYGVTNLMEFARIKGTNSLEKLKRQIKKETKRDEWVNLGGQLVSKETEQSLLKNIKTGKFRSWKDVHTFYKKCSDRYEIEKAGHAFASLLEIENITPRQLDNKKMKEYLRQSLTTREWMTQGVYDSRKKDYHNPFRRMVYHSEEQMNAVLGKLDENPFILLERDLLAEFRKKVRKTEKQLGL
ncbi:MAG: DUF4954 family protein [Chitinophagaceae bacterium]|nr:DUF4954 family protein [Chitinophagaceae bacterium]